jgi:signal peptidase II
MTIALFKQSQRELLIKQTIILLLLGGLFLLLDQLTKYFVLHASNLYSSKFFSVTLLFNKGSLWGLFASNNSNIIFVLLSVLAIGFIVYLLFQHQVFTQKIFLIILLVGIIGNSIDRILRGAVIDWINIPFWPIFNLADVYIVVSVFCLIYLIIQEQRQLS